MAAVILDLADAVVAQLNAATLSQAFTAERLYSPLENLETLTTLKVTVVPRSAFFEGADRNRKTVTAEIDIGVQRRSDLEQVDLDALMVFVEEIVDLFPFGGLSTYLGASVVGLANAPIWASDHLNEKHVFTSVITLTVKVWL
jgi:hypothetical protein